MNHFKQRHHLVRETIGASGLNGCRGADGGVCRYHGKAKTRCQEVDGLAFPAAVLPIELRPPQRSAVMRQFH